MAVCFSEKILVFLSILVALIISYAIYKLKNFLTPSKQTSDVPRVNRIPPVPSIPSIPSIPSVIIKTNVNESYRFPVRNGDNGGLIGYIQSSSKRYPLYLTRNRMKRKFFYHVDYSNDDNRLLLPIKVSNNDSDELYDSQEIFLNELSDTFRVNLYKDIHDI